MPNTQNSFHVYFHRDFDGICSAAIFAEVFLRLSTGKTIEFDFQCVDYDQKETWLAKELEIPNVVLDFLFHPKAQWWFDHHVSAFLQPDLKKKYNNGDKQLWNVEFKSCPSLIAHHFKRVAPQLTSAPIDAFREWIAWSDTIDSAMYSSPREIVELKHPCLQIYSTLAIDDSDKYRVYLVEQVRRKKPEEVAQNNEVKSKYERYQGQQSEILDCFSKLIGVVGNSVAFFDQSHLEIPFQRYLSYYFYPNLNYTVGVYRRNGHAFAVSVGKNPWKQFSSENLGELCKQFGGGGRIDVGAVIAEDHAKALDIAKNIVKKLRVS